MQVWPALRHLPKSARAASSMGDPASHDRGRLAAQLERHGSEVRRGRGHHLASHRGRPGEEQVVERQGDESPRDVGAAVHDREHLRSEPRRDEPGEEGARARCGLGHLDDHAVAGGQRADGRAEARGRADSSRAPTIPTTPRGWYITRERPGRNQKLVGRRCGLIQRARRRRAWRMPSRAGKISSSRVSSRERPRKSPSIASHNASAFSRSISSRARSAARRPSASRGAPVARSALALECGGKRRGRGVGFGKVHGDGRPVARESNDRLNRPLEYHP